MSALCDGPIVTCIVATVTPESVVMGADSAAVNNWELSRRAEPKVFRAAGGSMLIGGTTSFRMLDLLRYGLPDYGPVEDPHRFLVTTFIDEVRRLFADAGFAKKENNVESGGNFLIAFMGRLWEIGPDFQVGEAQERYAAVGSGSAAALGALHAATALGIRGQRAVDLALHAAEAHNIGVRGPFVFEELSTSCPR